MLHSHSVPSTTATPAKTALAFVAILSLLLSLFAIARPVIANHDVAGPAVTPTVQPGNPSCPEGTTEIKFEGSNLASGKELSTTIDGQVVTVEITNVSVSGGTFDFSVEGGVALVVIAKGGPNGNVYDYRPVGTAHDDGLSTPINPNNDKPFGLSHVTFCVVPIEASIIVYKTDQTGADVAGAEFTVKDGDVVVGGPAETGADGRVCFDDLVLDKQYTVIETAAHDGYLPADPDNQLVTAALGSCDDRAGDDPDATFTNTLLGSLLVLKTDDSDPAAPLEGAEFTVSGVDGTFTSDENGWFCVDGLVIGEEYTVTETMSPDGYEMDFNNPQTHTIDDAASCDERTADPVADLTFVNAPEEGEEPTGSITIVKEVDCDECDARTIGYYFNAADQHSEETNALFADLGGIMADGILFTNVDQVQQYRADDQDGTSDGQNGLSARGQLTLQYLAAQLNVARNGDECDLASRVYNNPESPFDGWTVGDILAEADAAFGGTSAFSDHEIQAALDDINNSSQADENPLSCEGSQSGTLDGVTFDIYLAADYPDGDPFDSDTTENGGVASFSGLTIGESYVIVESGFPEGVTCVITAVEGGDAELVDGAVHVTLTEESLDQDLNLTLTITNDCDEEQEEEVGSLLIAKEDDAGALLGGATFEVDGTPYADPDEDGFVCVDGLTLGDIVSVEETMAPEGYIGEEGAVDVPILNTDDCETRLGGADPQADADITFVNVPEEDEEEGIVEIDKLFCFTDDEAATEFFVFGPIFPEPLESLGAAEEEQPDEGCWTEDVSFTITGGDLDGPINVSTGDDGSLEINLPESENAYVITEDMTGESAEFFVEDGALTAIVVLNLVEQEEDTGLLKVIKLFCEGDAASVEFSVEGGDVPVPAISGCEVGDATFALGDETFSIGADGIALLVVEVGEYTFAEVAPNAAEYDGTIVVEEGEITTIIVINTFDEGEEGGGGGTTPGQNVTPREGTQGGNPLPNTATAPIPTGSVPAALLALLMLSGLGAAAHAVRAEAHRRR